jgi:N-acetylated-alpha-linked acidic dipeptidase
MPVPVRSLIVRGAAAAFVAAISLIALASARLTIADRDDRLFGFTESSSVRQRTIETRFLAVPSAARLQADHQYLTAEPHMAGTPRDRALAEWVRDEWTAAGIEDVEIVRHDVLLPYPRAVSVEMVAPRIWRASMKEDPIDGDPSTHRRDVGVPYHAYSRSGDVTATVVYAGSGNPSEYDWLGERGVDVRGKLVLVRYSVPYSYRGFKALTAQQRGASGLLIYSDPADDGFGKGKAYPDGPWGPESHIQRGGIVYDFMVPGDPLTPGWASIPGARRIEAKDAASIPHVMSAPLSYRDARVILEALGGPEAPPAWQGGLPVTYRVGPGPATVRLHLDMDEGVRPIWTVTGRIRGADRPDETVILGNHRDAWIFGGVDPSSGSAALMEVARALGSLARRGIRPRRTITLASWDAEEFTLTSSTEWGEQHADALRAGAVAYLNVDSAASGTRFSASSVPSLNRVILETLDRVADPAGAGTVGDAVRQAKPDAERGGAMPTGGGATRINNRLGSGSDYTVFLNHLGIPVADLSFDGPYGVYHSMYDDHEWMKRFGDPEFASHKAMAQIWGVLALRLANADVLPIDVSAYARMIHGFVSEAKTAAAWSPRAGALFAPLAAAADRLRFAADRLDEERERVLGEAANGRSAAAALDARIRSFERALLDPGGIPGRPWFRHQIYAPRFTYAAEILPAITEASDRKDEAALERAIAVLRSALERAAAQLAGS